jgi:hypothetical protein
MKKLIPLALFVLFPIQWQAPTINGPLPIPYVIERSAGSMWMPMDTTTQAPGIFEDTLTLDYNELYHIKGRALRGTERSVATVHLLMLDWAEHHENASIFEGSGGLPHTRVTIWLPAPQWTCTYAFQDSSPVYVKAHCDFDYTGDGRVNLSDFPTFGTVWVASGRNLALFAGFGACYGAVDMTWTYGR